MGLTSEVILFSLWSILEVDNLVAYQHATKEQFNVFEFSFYLFSFHNIILILNWNFDEYLAVYYQWFYTTLVIGSSLVVWQCDDDSNWDNEIHNI